MEGNEYIVFVEKKKKNVLSRDDVCRILKSLFKFVFNVDKDPDFERLYKFGRALLKSTYAFSAIAKDNIYFTYKLKLEDEWSKVPYSELQKIIHQIFPELSLRGFMKRLSIEYKEEIYEDYENACKGNDTYFKNPSFSKRWLITESPNDFFYTDVFADSILPQNVRRILKMSKIEFENYEKNIKDQVNYVPDPNYEESLNTFLKNIYAQKRNMMINNNIEKVWDNNEKDVYEKIAIIRMGKLYSENRDILFIKQKIMKLFDYKNGLLKQEVNKESILNQSLKKSKK
jgi:hypothetical protein